jgi:Predicted Co/Zn/Cd cation transporters
MRGSSVNTNQKSLRIKTADSKSSGAVESPASMSKEGTRITIIGMVVNIFLTALKIIFGIFGHSAALIADGLHSCLTC